MLALVAAVAWQGTGLDVVLPTAVLLAAALLTLWFVRSIWSGAGTPPVRLVRHAWTLSPAGSPPA